MRCIECRHYLRLDMRNGTHEVVCDKRRLLKRAPDMDRGCAFAAHKDAPKFSYRDRKYEL